MMRGITWLQAWPASPGFGQRLALAWVGRLGSVTIADISPTALDRRDAARRSPGEREAFLRRRMLARGFLAATGGRASAAIAIRSDEAGRPWVTSPHDDLWVSTSHREDWLGLAVAQGPVGVDVEPLDAPAEPAWAMLAPGETAWIMSLADQEQPHAFLMLWTAKEAYLKAMGDGLVREPSDLAVSVTASGPVIHDRGIRQSLAAAWWCTGDSRGRVLGCCVTLASSACITQPLRGRLTPRPTTNR